MKKIVVAIRTISAADDLKNSGLRIYPKGQLCKECKKSELSIYNKYDVCKACIDKRLTDYGIQLGSWSDRKIMKRVLRDLGVNIRKPIKTKNKDPRSVRWNA